MSPQRKFRPPRPVWRKRPGEQFGRVRYTFRGRRVEEVTRYETHEAAKPYLKRLTEALLSKFWTAETPHARRGPPPLSLGELAQKYIAAVYVEGRRRANTIRTQPPKLLMAVSWIGADRLAHEVDTGVLEAALALRLQAHATRLCGRERRPVAQKISSTTVNNELRLLRSCYRWAIRNKLLPDPEDMQRPARVVPWELGPNDWPRARTHRYLRLSDEEVDALVEGLDLERDTDRVLYLELVTGGRMEDIEDLTWGHLRGGAFLVGDSSKTGGLVVWPCPPAFAARLRRRGPLFTSRPTAPALRYRVKALTGNLRGIKALRHTVASAWAAEGVNPVLAKALMGHSTDTTGGYQHPRVSELRHAQEMLPWYARLEARASESGAESGRKAS